GVALDRGSGQRVAGRGRSEVHTHAGVRSDRAALERVGVAQNIESDAVAADVVPRDAVGVRAGLDADPGVRRVVGPDALEVVTTVLDVPADRAADGVGRDDRQLLRARDVDDRRRVVRRVAELRIRALRDGDRLRGVGVEDVVLHGLGEHADHLVL